MKHHPLSINMDVLVCNVLIDIHVLVEKLERDGKVGKLIVIIDRNKSVRI